MKRFRWRRRWMGHKHGVARGTAVFTSNGSNDADLPRDFHLPSERLRVWSRDHGVTLDESPESLSLLDGHLDAWNADATHHDKVDLSNEVGIYVGSVIVKHVEGAHWRVWPKRAPSYPARKRGDTRHDADDYRTAQSHDAIAGRHFLERPAFISTSSPLTRTVHSVRCASSTVEPPRPRSSIFDPEYPIRRPRVPAEDGSQL